MISRLIYLEGVIEKRLNAVLIRSQGGKSSRHMFKSYTSWVGLILINRGGVTARHGDPHRLEELRKETAIERLEAHVRGHE